MITQSTGNVPLISGFKHSQAVPLIDRKYFLKSIARGLVFLMAKPPETCALCCCKLNRSGNYANSTTEGRSHASSHHFVAERFFGRSANRPGTKRDGIFDTCPWGREGEWEVYCYECHEELRHNPVLLPEDIRSFSELVMRRNLREEHKPEHREMIAGRVRLMHEVISSGLKVLLQQESR